MSHVHIRNGRQVTCEEVGCDQGVVMLTEKYDCNTVKQVFTVQEAVERQMRGYLQHDGAFENVERMISSISSMMGALIHNLHAEGKLSGKSLLGMLSMFEKAHEETK
jgi:hypothetical protein